MYNWSVDEKAFKKADPKGYQIWRLEQMINWGLGNEKLNEKLVRKYWARIENRIDTGKKQYLKFLLFDKFPDKFVSSKFCWHHSCRLCKFLQGRCLSNTHHNEWKFFYCRGAKVKERYF